MDFPVKVDASLTLPVIASPLVNDNDAAMNVKFLIPDVCECYGKKILLTITVLVSINNMVSHIYKSRVIRVSYEPIEFDIVLPIGSIIIEAIPTYSILNRGY